MPHRTLNIDEVAEFVHLTRAEVEKLVRKNRIPHQKIGDRVIFRNVDVEQWASQRLLDTRAGDTKFFEAFHQRSTDTHSGESQDGAIIPDLLARGRIEPEMGAKTRASVLSEMTMLADESGMVNNPVDLLESLREREELCSTAMPDGIALLHPRHHHEYLFVESFIVFGRAGQPVPFGAPDGKLTDLFFLICCGDDKFHLHILARLCAMCTTTNLITDLRVAETAQNMFDLIALADLDVIRNIRR